MKTRMKIRERILKFCMFSLAGILFSFSSFSENADTYWIGQFDQNWHNPVNWSDGVPDSKMDVIILMHCANYPVINAEAECKNIEIQQLSSLTVQNNQTLYVYGNWTNNWFFSAGTGTIVFRGDDASINGIDNDFYNLNIEKTSGSALMVMNSDITVKNKLIMQCGDVFLNNHNIDLGTEGKILDECNNNKIFDDYLQGTGTIIVKRLGLIPDNEESFGNIGVTIKSNQYFGNTVIVRSHKMQNINNNDCSIYRYFDIIPEINENLEAELLMKFFNDEIPSVIDKEKLAFYESIDSGSTWNYAEGTVFPLFNYIKKNNVNSFSRVTASEAVGTLTKVIETEDTDNYIFIYPVPVSDYLTVKCGSSNESYTLSIYNLNGMLIKNINISNSTSIDVRNYPPGAYSFIVRNINTKKSFARIIIIE